MVTEGKAWLWRMVDHWWQSLQPVLNLALIAALVLLVAGIIVFALDKNAFIRARDWLVRTLTKGIIWIPVLAVVAFSSFALEVVDAGVNLRFQEERSAVYSKRGDSSGGGTLQYSPSISFEEENTLNRSFTIPPEIASQLGTNPVEALKRYLDDNPTAKAVKSVDDSFERRGDALLYLRKVVVTERKPVSLESALVNVNFDVNDTPNGRPYYRARFEGTYKFLNPLPRATNLRFVFPLPLNSGTLTGFEMSVNGSPVTVADLTNGYVWEGEIPASASTEVRVRYDNSGAQTWHYGFGQRREAIRDFTLRVTTPRAAEYARDSLFPTTANGQSLEWRLQNVVTSQDVDLAFLSEGAWGDVGALFAFTPLALLAMAAWIIALAWRRQLPLEPARLVIALLGLTVGVALSGVLLWYVGDDAAAWLGALAAAVLALSALGGKYALPVAMSAASPLAFLSPDAPLILVGFAVIALVTVLPPEALENLRGLWRKPRVG
jgi:hypothetical protein